MADDKKVRVAVLYGGRSSEHDVSLQSAACVLAALDRTRFEPVPIAIDRDGTWHIQDLRLLDANRDKALPLDASAPSVALAAHPGATLGEGRGIDVVLPIVHGPLCEDGSLQGLLELADLPYVGSGVLGSAICMDKDVAKRLARAAGIETVNYLTLRRGNWSAEASNWRRQVRDELGYPVFVKPANLGSSVGISRARDESELDAALDLAFGYDDKVLIEQAVDAREIELAVLSSADGVGAPEVSVPGEINANEAFYTYERKYEEASGARLQIPAALDEAQTREAQSIARRAFVALECDGMARIDLFLDRASGRLLFSEANTIPGFTTISMYPKLWEASGVGYGELLARLIEHARARHARRSGLKRSR
jgi:D-alanine-D-alanine ligase